MRTLRTNWDTNADLIEHDWDEEPQREYEREEEEYYNDQDYEDYVGRDCRD